MIIELLILISCALLGQSWYSPHVEVAEGILEGTTYVTEDGIIVHKFLGVPYASPPVGTLRFKAPRRASCWSGIREAKEFASVCKSFPLQNIMADEDCLYLNVYTSNLNQQDNLLPVMIYLRGGGFQIGTVGYVPDWLMMEDIVYVNIEYRVGVFGFLSLDIAEAPGNAGLKDQVAAFKWIKRNIAAFGGDPDDIMVFGNSAGSVSINYHLVSDMSKGLFHKAAMMSGSALNPWGYITNHKEYGLKLCNKVGCPTEDASEALECLLSLSSDELLQAQGKPPTSTIMADDNMYFKELIFVPSIEKKFQGHERFLTESAHERMKTGHFHKMPIMAGFADAECINEVNDTVADPVLFGLIDIDFERYVPRELGLQTGSEESICIADQIREFYYGEEPIDEDAENFIRVKTDSHFKRGINEMVKLLADKSPQPVYYYRFSFYDSDFRRATDLMFYKGASHLDDLYFLFYSIFSQTNILPRYKREVERTRKRMVKLYTNFAKYGNPTPKITGLLPVKWIPVSRYKLNYLSIDENLCLSSNPDQVNIEFWENIIENAQRGIY